MAIIRLIRQKIDIETGKLTFNSFKYLVVSNYPFINSKLTNKLFQLYLISDDIKTDSEDIIEMIENNI